MLSVYWAALLFAAGSWTAGAAIADAAAGSAAAEDGYEAPATEPFYASHKPPVSNGFVDCTDRIDGFFKCGPGFVFDTRRYAFHCVTQSECDKNAQAAPPDSPTFEWRAFVVPHPRDKADRAGVDLIHNVTGWLPTGLRPSAKTLVPKASTQSTASRYCTTEQTRQVVRTVAEIKKQYLKPVIDFASKTTNDNSVCEWKPFRLPSKASDAGDAIEYEVLAGQDPDCPVCRAIASASKDVLKAAKAMAEALVTRLCPKKTKRPDGRQAEDDECRRFGRLVIFPLIDAVTNLFDEEILCKSTSRMCVSDAEREVYSVRFDAHQKVVSCERCEQLVQRGQDLFAVFLNATDGVIRTACGSSADCRALQFGLLMDTQFVPKSAEIVRRMCRQQVFCFDIEKVESKTSCRNPEDGKVHVCNYLVCQSDKRLGKCASELGLVTKLACLLDTGASAKCTKLSCLANEVYFDCKIDDGA